MYFNIVAQSSESTVVTEYKPQSKRSEAYQSEADLEKEFIRLLCELGYERLTIHKEADLIANLRTQLYGRRMEAFLGRGAGKHKLRHSRKDPPDSGGLCAGAPPG